MPQISIYCAESLLREYAFVDERIISIGRAVTNDIVLPDSSRKISRHHAVLIEPKSGMPSWFVRDLGSRYSLRVRGEVTACSWLRDNDTIEIVNYKLVLHCEAREIQADHLRVVAKRSSDHAFDESTLDLHGLTSADRAHLTDIQQELITQLKQVSRVTRDPFTSAATLMPAVCRVVQANRGFIRLFRPAAKVPHVDLGIVGLGPQDAIEVAAPQFMRRIMEGYPVIEPDAVLCPIVGERSIIGILAVDKLGGSEPFSSEDLEFLLLVGKILGKQLEVVKSEPRAPCNTAAFQWPKALVGRTKAMKEVNRQLRDAALNRENVLILGETGTGKELVARDIHDRSGRKGKLVTQNVAQLTETLAESEIFGYVPKSGIAGADPNGAPGWFELAENGTLLLDEIHRLTPALQDKLLRVLQEKEIYRIGARVPKPVNVKILAATDCDVEKAIDEGLLRKAFYFRFGQVIRVPALRERRDDIPLLAYYFLDNLEDHPRVGTRCISHRAMEALLQYDWPGNVRELQSCIAGGVRSGNEIIFTWNLPDYIQQHRRAEDKAHRSPNRVTPISDRKARSQTLEELEREKILETLEATHGNKTQSAQLLGITRMTVLSKMDRYGIPRNYGEIAISERPGRM